MQPVVKFRPSFGCLGELEFGMALKPRQSVPTSAPVSNFAIGSRCLLLKLYLAQLIKYKCRSKLVTLAENKRMCYWGRPWRFTKSDYRLRATVVIVTQNAQRSSGFLHGSFYHHEPAYKCNWCRMFKYLPAVCRLMVWLDLFATNVVQWKNFVTNNNYM